MPTIYEMSHSEPRTVTVTPISDVSRVLPVRGLPRRAGHDRNEWTGSEPDNENEDYQRAGAGVRAAARTRGGAMGQCRDRARTAGATERTQDMDRARDARAPSLSVRWERSMR